MDVLVDCVQKKQILHSHYLKEMSRIFLIKNSKLGLKSKRNIISADSLRVMRDLSTLSTDNERTSIVHFIHKTQYSGYSVQESIEVYRCV